MSHAAVLVLALLLDAALGEPRWLWSRLPHPAVLMGRAVAALDHRLNNGAARRLRGGATLAVLVLGAGLLGLMIAWLGPLAELVCAAILIAQKSLADHVRAVADGLRRSVGEGRQAVAMIVSRDCRDMDGPRVARAAIESGAENLSDGVVAPAFWFLLFGAPGIMIYKAVNTADSMIGYRNDRYEDFGKAAARADDLLNLIPARLTGVLIAGLTGQMRRWREIAADARRHRSPNAGWPEAAMARALDVALAGPRSYDGTLRDLAWVNGAARREIGADDIDAAVGILWQVWAALLVLAIASAAVPPLL
ncbi:adenosylcobinamide-phosphate synthase CbiB [Seohaeicola saemankumensis]|nr:adenosylcobinamide-phosphate synthase CbiB [Seohaeicola saemankumensis]MCA0872696.1 adenosylcobinamide-phosphate synthase CbiB [Seohaeicola saemankumensis]